MKKKKAIPIVIALALIIAAILIVKSRSDFLYAGTIEATKIDVPARVSSVIGVIDIHEGDKVKVGQALMTLTGEDLKIAAETAERDYARAEKLYKSGSMPQESYDHLRGKRDDAALRWNWCTITSSINGTVLNTYKEKGEWVSPGAKLLTLADLSEVWTLVYVAQPLLAKLSLGAKAEGYLPEMSGKTFEGKITKISDEAEFTPKNVQTREERTRLVYGIKVTFPNPDGILKPGMSVEVRLPR